MMARIRNRVCRQDNGKCNDSGLQIGVVLSRRLVCRYKIKQAFAESREGKGADGHYLAQSSQRARLDIGKIDSTLLRDQAQRFKPR